MFLSPSFPFRDVPAYAVFLLVLLFVTRPAYLAFRRKRSGYGVVFNSVTGIPEPLKGIFREIHSDLLTSRYWRVMLRRVRNGEIMDITPYDRSKRFRNRKVY